jgi:hypothetical protein
MSTILAEGLSKSRLMNVFTTVFALRPKNDESANSIVSSATYIDKTPTGPR